MQVPLISGGFLLCWQHEQNYHVLGVVGAVSASVFRAGKSVAQELLLSNQKRKIDSASLLYFMAPYSMFVLLALSIVLEGWQPYASFYDFEAGQVQCDSITPGFS